MIYVLADIISTCRTNKFCPIVDLKNQIEISLRRIISISKAYISLGFSLLFIPYHSNLNFLCHSLCHCLSMIGYHGQPMSLTSHIDISASSRLDNFCHQHLILTTISDWRQYLQMSPTLRHNHQYNNVTNITVC